jgi:tetratricopeptide (TPR) repeat protein
MSADHTVPTSLVDAFRDRYDLVRETGRGGSATVYLARDLKHDRFVAIKVLNPDVGHATGERFLREIQVSAGMQHPHILPTYDSGVADGRLYFVMPFVDGGSLRQRLDAATALPTEESLRIAHDIGVALAHAHDLGVVHRDVKPENIMFYHGHACLADFGVARAIEQMDAGITGHGTVVGTPAYMSPEQVTSQGFDGRSDVYSLACVLYEMIAGTRLFDGATAREVLIQRTRRPSISKLRPTIPACVDVMLTRALATLPDDRFPDARTFVAAIEDAMTRLDDVPKRISAPRRAIIAMQRRKWTYASVLGVVLFVGLAFTPLRDVVGLRRRNDVLPDARRAYQQGHAALATWEIPVAEKAFAEAATLDSASPHARYWLAQSMALGRRMSSGDFRVATARLAPSAARLHGRDSLFAAALVAMGRGQPRLACEAYAARLAQDSLDAMAWYGMGDCQALDSSVVRDPRSPSGWRYSSSWHTAANAYMRAATLDPNTHQALPYSLFTFLLPTTTSYVRAGLAEGPPRQRFAGFPGLDADTVTFVPWPIAEFGRLRATTLSPTRHDALQRNRAVLLPFAQQWAAAAPLSADAHEALGLAREALGEIESGPDDAMAAVERARALARTPLQQTRLAAARVRLLVTRGDFAGARTVADSVIDAWQGGGRPDPDVAGYVSGLAALTGRFEPAARYMTLSQSPRNASAGITPALTAASSRYFMRAALGACGELDGERQAFERSLESQSSPAQRSAVRDLAIRRAATLAFTCGRRSALAGLRSVSALERAQQALAQGNRSRARIILDSLAEVRRTYRPGDVALDHTLNEAWLRSVVGDAAGAARQLDRVLDALPTLSTFAVREEAQSAAVARTMFLRAELASAQGDSVTARRWAGNALALWANAEPLLQPAVARLRQLSQ